MLASCCAFSSGHPVNRPSKWVHADQQQKQGKPFVIIVPEIEQNEVDYDPDELETAANSPATSVADKSQVVVEVIKAMEIDLSNLRLEGNGGRNEEEEDQTPYFQNLVVPPYSKVHLEDSGQVVHSYRDQPLPFIQFGEHLVGSASERDKFPASPSTPSCKTSRACFPTTDSNFSDDFDLESRTLLGNTLIRNDNKNEIKQMKNSHRTGSVRTRPYFMDVGFTDILKLAAVKKEDKTRYPVQISETTLTNVNDKIPRRVNTIFRSNQPPRLNVYTEEVMNIDPIIQGEPEKQLAGRIKIKRRPVSHWDFGLKTVNGSTRPRWSDNHLSQQNFASTHYRKVEPVNVNNYYNLLQHRQEGAPFTSNAFSLHKGRQNYFPPGQIYYTYNTPQVVNTNQAFRPNVQRVNRDEIMLLADYYPTSYDIPKPQQTFEKRPFVWETIYLPRSLVEMYLQANKAIMVQNTYRANENVDGYKVNTRAPFFPINSIPMATTYISSPSYISVKNLGS